MCVLPRNIGEMIVQNERVTVVEMVTNNRKATFFKFLVLSESTLDKKHELCVINSGCVQWNSV